MSYSLYRCRRNDTCNLDFNSVLERSLGEQVHRTGRLMRQRLVEELAKEGFEYPVEFWPTLKYLYLKGLSPQHDLAEYLVRDKATVARLIRRMKAAGLVEHTVDPQIKRRKQVVITPLGCATFERLSVCAIELKRRAFSGVDTDQLQTCQDVLACVFENLSIPSS